MINVSFNDLAIGSDLPTPRTASRPAEASTFAALMDDADARQPRNDDTRARRGADARDATRTERPASGGTQPSEREANDPPTRDATTKSTAPTPRGKADTAAPRGKASTAGSATTKDGTIESPARQAAADGAASKTAGAADDTSSQPQTDKTFNAESANTVSLPIPPPAIALIQTPAEPAVVAPTFAASSAAPAVGAPQAAAPVAPSAPDGDSAPQQTQPEQAATPTAATPVQPTMAKSGDAAPDTASPIATPAATATTSTVPAATDSDPASAASRSTIALSSPDGQVAPATIDHSAPAGAPANATGRAAASTAIGGDASTIPGKTTAATLFAATALAQPATEAGRNPQSPVLPQAALTNAAHPEPAVQVPFQAAQQVASQTVSADAATAAKPLVSYQQLDTIQPAEPAPRQASAAQNSSAAPMPTNQPSAAASQPQTAANLASLLGGNQRIDIELSQDAAPTPLKPAPALANGMIAQIGVVQSSETKTGTPAATTALGGVDAGTAAPSVAPAQTAMAIAAAPTVQAAADEPRPKLTATAEGLVINAPAPAATPHTLNANALDPTAAGKPTVPTPPVFDQVAVHVAKAAADGLDKINIKLKPASLGQIEVQLEVASDGRVHAVIAADKPETLDLLQRDARALERALGDAGLRADSGSLSFNLRGQGQQQYGNTGHGFTHYGTGAERSRNDIALPADNAVRLGAYLNSRAAAGGVDIRV